jgi:phosphoribosylamine--glycine ligase
VVVANTVEDAEAALADIFSGRAGAGASAVVEEFLDGEEASFFVLCDGRTALPFGTAQDHKRAGDGDTGPNTGGMGAYSPAPVMTEEMCARAMREIVEPTLKTMAARGAPFVGVLFAGLMISPEGPKLVEYNVRFGDPECQVLMPRLKDDLLTLLIAAVDGTLDKVSVRWWPEAALSVVMATKGYPGTYGKGSEIKSLERAAAFEGIDIFHAGTRREGGRLLAHGGRVLDVTARGHDIAEAQRRAYAAVGAIDWPEGFYRRDIGWRAVGRRP